MEPNPGEIVPDGHAAALPDDVIANDEQGQPSSVVDPNQRFGKATALLKIHQHKGGFLVEGKSAVIDPLEVNRDAPYARPTLAPSEIEEMDKAQFPRAMIWLMKEWSKSYQGITQWINGLRAELHDELRLVIWDDTGFGIPWELLWLGGSTDHHPSDQWLGSLVSVTRWITMFEDKRNPYSDQPTQCEGHVIAHLQEEMAEDYGALEQYTMQSVEQAKDLADFFARAGNEREPFGFVYMAAHGTARKKIFYFKLADKQMWSLEGKFSALRSRHGLVFLNACESGVHIIDPMLGGDLVHGFAQLFLSEGAQGVIATLGTVGGNYAREVAKGVFSALAAASDAGGHIGAGAQIAVVLRELRAQAAREAPDPFDDSADLRPFLDTFMYVYYGNPSTTVRLTRRQPSHA